MSLLDKLNKEEFLFDYTSAYEKLIDRIDPKVAEQWEYMPYHIYKEIGLYRWEADFKKCQ